MVKERHGVVGTDPKSSVTIQEHDQRLIKIRVWCEGVACATDVTPDEATYLAYKLLRLARRARNAQTKDAIQGRDGLGPG